MIKHTGFTGAMAWAVKRKILLKSGFTFKFNAFSFHFTATDRIATLSCAQHCIVLNENFHFDKTLSVTQVNLSNQEMFCHFVENYIVFEKWKKKKDLT